MSAVKDAMERAAKLRTGVCVMLARMCRAGMETRIEVRVAPRAVSIVIVGGVEEKCGFGDEGWVGGWVGGVCG